MKKLVALILTLALFVVGAMLFVSCGDEPCTEHVDADSDGVCDECGATVETGKNPPEDPTDPEDPDDPEDPVNPPPGTGDPEGCTHDIVTVGEKAPTCTEAGYNAHEYCTKCTYTTKVEVAALNHDLKSEAAKASTCAEVGWNAYEYCSRCDYTTKVELPLGAHTTAVIPGTDATCVSLGATPKVYCSVCQCVFVESVEIPYASHDYGDGFECTVCKAEVASLGLEYTLSADKTYYKVKGMGSCTDTLLAIPAVHEGLPVKEIGYEAFRDKTFVSGVIIPESITRIDGSAFSGCTGIENIYFNAVDCTMGAGTSTISVFQNVGKNTDGVTVHIGAKVKKIPSYFLYAYGANTAANVTNVVYSEDGVLESIGYKAFECVQSLKAITIPETVKSISSNAFRSCSLQAVYYKAVDATATSGIFDSASGSGGIVLFVGKDVKKIPDNFMNASSDSYVPSVSEIVFESGSVCEYIGKFAFQKIKMLDSLVLPPSMKELGQRAFSYMPSLSSVTLNEGFVKLGSYAFADNGVTLSVSFPNSIKEFGDWEFENTTLADEIFTVYGNCKYIGNENNPYAVLYGVNVTDTLTKENISEVTIHADTKAIYPSAFQGCKALESVVVPDGVKSLGSYAFAGCSALKSVTLGSGVTDILMYTFNGCKLLDTLTVKGELTSIAAYAFNNCAALGEFTVPATVENIAAGAFYGCSSLETVSGMAGVKTIGANAFYNCASLVTVSIPDGIESIGTSAFAGCTALNYHVEGGVKYLGNAKNPAIILVSAESKSTITSADIPETTRIILSSAFVSASNLKTVTGGEGVIYIGEAAFSSCSALETIPAFESLTYIGQNAFNVCSSLKAINIGENVSYIGNQAFRYCKAVTEIKFSARNLLDSPGYYGTAGMYETAFHSVGQNGEGVAVTIGKSATRLPAYIFAGHTNESDSYHVNVKSVTFEAESSCTEIGTYAFEYVSSFSTIDIPASVKTIGAGAFGDCSGLVTVTGMSGVETIGSSAFSWCSSLESVPLSNKLTSLGSYAFSGCSKLASANLPESLTSIPQSAFSNCSSLAAITIPSGVTSIGSYAFSNCKGLTSITYNAKNVPDFEDENYVFNNAGQNGAGIALTIGKDVKVVPAYLFNPYDTTANAPKIASVSFESGSVCERIGRYAFAYCQSIASVSLPAGLKYIESCAFSRCAALLQISIPASVSELGSSAFSNCTSLKSAALPDTLTTIGSSAFYNCTALETVNIPASLTDLSDNPFSGCTSLNYNVDGGVQYLGSSENPYMIAVGLADNTVTEITLNANTVMIFPNAFKGKTAITSVALNSGLKKIFPSAFQGCTALTSVVIPAGIESFGSSVFQGCTGLTSVTIGSNIGASAFSGCTKLETITFGEGCTSIGNSAFSGCNKLAVVNIPDTVNEIGASAFKNCTGITTLTIGKGVQKIGAEAFGTLTALTTVNYNAKAVSDFDTRDTGAFYKSGATNGITVIFSSDVERIPAHLFQVGSSYTSGYAKVVSVKFGEGFSADEIGEHAFSGLSSIVSVHIADFALFVKGSFESTPLQYCEELYIGETLMTELVLDESITEIGEGVFINCSAIEKITIKGNVTKIGKSVFKYCTALREVVILGSVPAISDGMFYGCTSLETVTLAGAASIGKQAFYDCTKLSSVNVPDTVTAIGDSAFYNCVLLTSVNIPSSVISLGNGVFSGCKALATVTGMEGVTSIPNAAFKNTAITSFTVPAGVIYIGASAFEGCEGLEKINIPASVSAIDSKAFKNASTLEEVTVNGILTVGSDAFYGCINLEKVTAPSLKIWCAMVFGDEYASPAYMAGKLYIGEELLVNLVIPSEITVINPDVFNGVKSIETVSFTDTIEKIGASAFANTEIKSVTIPSVAHWCSVVFENMGANPLVGTKQLVVDGKIVAELVIPEGVTAVGNYAFAGCLSLVSVTIPSTVEYIGGFQYCYKLLAIKNLSSVELTLGDLKNGGIAEHAKKIVGDGETLPVFTNSDGFVFYKDGTECYLVGYIGEAVEIELPTDCDGGVYEIYTRAFTDRPDLEEVRVNGGVTAIGELAFYEMPNLREVYLNGSVKTIGKWAFAYCDKLEYVDLVDKDTKNGDGKTVGAIRIEDNAFTACTALRTVELAEELEFIGQCAFEGCTSLKYLTLPLLGNLKTISNRAFIGSGLKTIITPESVETIGDYAFADCKSLTSVDIYATPVIGYRAFYGCSSLATASLTPYMMIYVSPDSTKVHYDPDVLGWMVKEPDGSQMLALYLRDTYSGYYWKTKNK